MLEGENSSLPPPRLDEYDVVIPKAADDGNGGGGQFRVQFTKQGNTIFWDYKRLKDGSMGPAERFQWFRNKGDIFLYVDGVSTTDKSFQQVMDLMRKSWSERSFSCFRMKNIKYRDHAEEEIHMSLERKLEQLSKEVTAEEEQMVKKQNEILQLEMLLERRKQEVRLHKQEISTRKTEIKQLQREELKKRQEQVLRLQQSLAAVESDTEEENEGNVQEPSFDASLLAMVEAIPPPSTTETSPSSTFSEEQPLLELEGQAVEEDSPLMAETGLTLATSSHGGDSEEGNENPENATSTVDAAVAYLVRDASGPTTGDSQVVPAEHFVFEQIDATDGGSSTSGGSSNNNTSSNNKSRRMCPRPSLFSRRNKTTATSSAATSRRGSKQGSNLV